MRTRLITAFLTHASLLLLIPSPVIGQVPPEDCAIVDQHFSQSPPTDLGYGMVTTPSYPLASSSGSFRFESREVTQCASGDQLDIVFVDDPSPGEAGGFYAGQLAVEFEEQIAGNVFRMLSEIKREAELLGLPVIESNETREVCGCAAFYPDLRGAKEAARVPMAEMRALATEPKPDTTKRPFDRISFIPERIDFDGPSSKIVSIHTPPAALGTTRYILLGFRDFKNCTTNEAIRVTYSAHGDTAKELARNSPLASHGGMAALRFESALGAVADTDLDQLSALAWSYDLRAEESSYAVDSVDCDALLENGGFQSED